MKRSALFNNFDRISEAPDAIPRLRRFVLDLAVRGKLVEQDGMDEPASELLTRIHVEKTRILRAGGIRKEEALPPLVEDQLPFRVPENWKWSQLGEIGFLNPRNSAADELPASFVPMPSISAEYGVACRHQVRPWGEIKSGYTHFAEGDVALAKITPCFENGKSAVFRGLSGGLGAGTTELHIVRPVFVNADYALIFLKSPHFIESGRTRMTGTAGQKRVPTEYFAYSPFPLPPLAEQHRIVAKVDELMALCDRLGAVQAERERSRNRLTAASLDRLNQPANADDGAIFREHARFQISHLSRFTTRPDQITALRQTILDLAVRGRLVTQNANDEPASDLFKRIQIAKARLINEGMIPLPEVSSRARNGLVLGRPMNWEAVTLSDLCNVVTSGSRGWAEYYSKTGPKFIRAQNIRFGTLRFHDLACVSPPKKTEGRRTQVAKGDLLIVITGAGVTNPALLNHEIGEAYVSQHVALVRPTDKSLSEWILLCLMAPAGARAELVERAYGAGKPGLNLDNIRSLALPLPPLAEQRRILAKVHELIAVCDRLEVQLTTAQIDSRLLLEAILHKALLSAA